MIIIDEYLEGWIEWGVERQGTGDRQESGDRVTDREKTEIILRLTFIYHFGVITINCLHLMCIL